MNQRQSNKRSKQKIIHLFNQKNKNAAFIGSLFIHICPVGQMNVLLMVQGKEKCRRCFYNVAAGEANYDMYKLTDRTDAHDGVFNVCLVLSREGSCDQTAVLNVRQPPLVQNKMTNWG